MVFGCWLLVCGLVCGLWCVVCHACLVVCSRFLLFVCFGVGFSFFFCWGKGFALLLGLLLLSFCFVFVICGFVFLGAGFGFWSLVFGL